MMPERERSEKAFQELDPGDIDAAIEMGSDICKELGICCAEKGKVMFQVFKKLQEQQAKEAAAAPPVEQPTEKTKEGGEDSA